MSDQPVAETAIYTAHIKHKGRTSMSSAGFDPAIRANKWLETKALARTATGIGKPSSILLYWPHTFEKNI
jgi:hypothetical protein